MLLVTINSLAQPAANIADTTKTRKGKFLPTGVRAGIDVVGPIRNQLADNFSGWEATVDIDFNRYLLVADYGYTSSQFSAEGSDYRNDGNYWRAGIDANFLTRDKDRNVFFLGLHYGRSSYNETMSITTEDPIWGSFTQDYSNQGLNARWLELNGGLKVKIWRWLWLGYTARYKFGLKQDESKEMLSHEIPGYGRTNDPATWGFNYYVFMRLPFRKTTPILGR